MKLVTTMTTLGDMTALKAFLDQYAVPKYFHSTVLDETTNPRTLTCYTDSTQNAGMILKAYGTNTSGYVTCFNGEETIDFIISQMPARTALATDNAIVLFIETYHTNTKNSPILIAKNGRDQTCIMAVGTVSANSYYISDVSRASASYDTMQLHIIPLDVSPSRWLLGMPFSVSTRADGKVLGVAYPTLDGILKNVWVVTSGSFYTVNEPFLYEIDGESYVGVSRNTFIIKST